MPSQAEIEPYTSQSAPPAPEYFHQSPEWAQDQKIKNQRIMARSRRDYYANMHVNNFDEQFWPSQNLTTQQHILHQDSTSWYDSRSITRLLDREPGLSLSLHDTDELVQHGDVITSNSREHPTILEINELSENDRDDEYEEKIVAKSQSVSYAVVFVKNILDKCKASPEVDLHPDGEVSLTWRSNGGIINIAFGEDGVATYAAYFPLHKETHKGKFSVSSVIPETIMNIIDRIEKQ